MTFVRRFAFGATLALVPLACGPDELSLGYNAPFENRGAMPVGEVWSCYGGPCPYGECDNDDFFTDVDCDDAYPAGGVVDEQSVFCQPGEDGDYCLVLGSDTFVVDYWVVKCSGTVSTATRCGRGCEDRNGTSRCN